MERSKVPVVRDPALLATHATGGVYGPEPRPGTDEIEERIERL